MKRILMMMWALCTTALLQAQTPLETYIERCADKAPLKGALLGVSVKDMSGKSIAAYNASTRMVPASNLKLVTTGTALHAFGPAHRFSTAIGYTGTITDGTLEGDVYILGGGDPSLGAKDTLALKADALFWKWKTLLRDAGIQRIHGRIVGDGNAYEGMLEQASWNYDDVGTYYGAGMSALSFYENAVDYRVGPAQAGEPVQLTQLYPETPWMHLGNLSVTSPAGTPNTLYMYTTDLAPYEELRGAYPLERRPKTEHFANKFGDLTCAYYFWKNLRETGWEVTGGYARTDRYGFLQGPDFVPADKAGVPVRIGATESAPLADLSKRTNWDSDNFYAEALFRAMGESATGHAGPDSCLVAVRDVLQDLGLPLDGISQADGCGLSRKNLVSADWMTRYLLSMTRSPAFGAFLESLPQPGQGTLSMIHLQNGERIRCKSGSMEGVLCYSGYILDSAGKPLYAFSILTNGITVPLSELRPVLSGILALMVQ